MAGKNGRRALDVGDTVGLHCVDHDDCKRLRYEFHAIGVKEHERKKGR